MTPEWLIDIGHGSVVGVGIDDGCLVVLTKHPSGEWLPTTHIPPEATQRLSEIAEVGWPTAGCSAGCSDCGSQFLPQSALLDHSTGEREN